jgi:hypothetical protein
VLVAVVVDEETGRGPKRAASTACTLLVEIEPGRVEVIAATRSVRELKGRFGKPKRAVSIEEMNAAIAAQATRSR